MDKCKYCIYAKVSNEDKEFESFLELINDESYLICTNVFNINSRNINDGSARIISMDTDIKAPKIGFKVDDDGYCGEFKLNKQTYNESNCWRKNEIFVGV